MSARHILWGWVALAFVSAGCARESGGSARSFDWLDPQVSVHRELERFIWHPGELSDPWSRGFSHGVERNRSGREYAWARAQRSRFHLETLTPGERTLVLDGFPVRDPRGQPQTVEVVLGGRPIATLEWTQLTRHEVPLPPGALVSGRNELILRYGYLQRPIDLGISETDTRELSMAWHEIALLPPGGPPGRNDAARGPSAERRQNVEPQLAGSTLQDGSSIWWRWTPTSPGSRLVAEATATGSDTHLAVVLDDGSRTWTTLHEKELDSGESFAVDLPLDGLPGSVARVGIAVYRGSVRWQTLRTSCVVPDGFAPRPVVLVTLDTSRRDAFGMYEAAAAEQSPTFDALGAQGIIFDRAYCPTPATAPTHASLLLSRHPHEHGLRINGHPLPPITGDHLAVQLKAWGYQTAAFVSLAVLADDTGFPQGFDHYDDDFAQGWWRFAAEVNENALPWIAERPWPAGGGPTREGDAPWFLWLHYPDPHAPYGVVDEPGRGVIVDVDREELGTMPTMGLRYTWNLQLTPGHHAVRLRAPEGSGGEMPHLYICRRVRVRGEGVSREFGEGWEWIRGYRRMGTVAELFLDVGALDAEDTAPRAVELEIALEDVPTPEESRRRYAEEVAAMDQAFAALLDQLEHSGWLEDGVILVAADHGEDLGEHDGHFGHVEHVGPTLSLVPMLLHDPLLATPARIDAPVSTLDIAPTLFARLGLPSAPSWRGVDALHVPMDRPVYLETYPPEAKKHWRGVVKGRLFLQGVIDPTLADPSASDAEVDSIPPPQLFDVLADPECSVDLAATLRESSGDGSVTLDELSEMSTLWLKWIESGTIGPESDLTTDPKMLERLRALGYVQ